MERLDRLIHERHHVSGAPSLSAGVFRHGATLYTASRGNGRPDALYQTASLGKHFTAALALLLRERGDCPTLDAPVAPSLPEIPISWSGITLRQLLSHTAGIPASGYESLDFTCDYTDSQIVRAIASGGELECLPGAAWNYSNAGYVLAGIALGRIAGSFYGNLLQELVFDPLGMTSATVNSFRTPVGHVQENDRVVSAEFVSPTLNRLADGGLCLSLLDLARWEAALSSEWGVRLNEMFVETMLTTGAPSGYGLGWFLRHSDRGRVAEHDGAWQGFSTAMIRYLDEGLSAVVLADLEGFDASGLAAELAVRCWRIG
jgi:CubicO group peptidase (beta-lactamase class C family)